MNKQEIYEDLRSAHAYYANQGMTNITIGLEIAWDAMRDAGDPPLGLYEEADIVMPTCSAYISRPKGSAPAYVVATRFSAARYGTIEKAITAASRWSVRAFGRDVTTL